MLNVFERLFTPEEGKNHVDDGSRRVRFWVFTYRSISDQQNSNPKFVLSLQGTKPGIQLILYNVQLSKSPLQNGYSELTKLSRANKQDRKRSLHSHHSERKM